uniref:Pectinesterase catalytic domain-containing protein n=1 Tax=Leersia perrieri TaxID=77586 RepID=A0A0D9VUI0_9ORYZ
MKDLTVQNTTGACKHQAVALQLSSDNIIVCQCSLEGYQDMLYAQKGVLFYQECGISVLFHVSTSSSRWAAECCYSVEKIICNRRFWVYLSVISCVVIHAAIVGQDGSDNFSTVATALERSQKRDTILVKAGIYDEIFCVKRLTWNLTLVGDGVGMTIITGNRSTDDGFIMHEMEFSSTGSAESQNCSMLARLPLTGQQNIVKALGRLFTTKDSYCTVTSDVYLGNTFTKTYLSRPRKIYFCTATCLGNTSVETYLGRPWKIFSRVVFMDTFINPAG